MACNDCDWEEVVETCSSILEKMPKLSGRARGTIEILKPLVMGIRKKVIEDEHANGNHKRSINDAKRRISRWEKIRG